MRVVVMKYYLILSLRKRQLNRTSDFCETTNNLKKAHPTQITYLGIIDYYLFAYERKAHF